MLLQLQAQEQKNIPYLGFLKSTLLPLEAFCTDDKGRRFNSIKATTKSTTLKAEQVSKYSYGSIPNL
jgi:hypothetical protein